MIHAAAPRPPLILVVDDDFLIRLNIAEILEEAGFAVLEAANSASALEVLRDRSEVSVVCTDVQMPGELDGVELLQRIRKHQPHIKTILMSAVSHHQRRLSNVPFLMKPFPSTRLVDLVRKQLEMAV